MSTVSFGSGLSGLDGQKVAVLGGPQMRAKSRFQSPSQGHCSGRCNVSCRAE